MIIISLVCDYFYCEFVIISLFTRNYKIDSVGVSGSFGQSEFVQILNFFRL